MKNCFVKLLALVTCTSMLLCSCGRGRSEYEMERDAKEEAVYSRGYEAGHEEGEWEGREEAQEDFEQTAEDIAWDARHLYGLDPEEAIMILGHYADGEPITKQELYAAIWTIHRYYYDMQDAIHDIDSYLD